MGESGCVQDGVFQNLEVNGFATINNTRSMVQQKVIYSPNPATDAADAAKVAQKVFYLPTRSIITSIEVVCVREAVIALGKIGYKVGIAPSGAELVLEGTKDQILKDGTKVPIGSYYKLAAFQGDTPNTNAAPLAATRVNIGIDPKPYYLQLTATTASSAIGRFAWIVTYKQF